MPASLEKKGEGRSEKKEKKVKKGEGKLEKKEKKEKKGEGKMEEKEKMGEGERKEKKKKKAVDILAGSDDESDGGGEELGRIQINEEYARRFEHNKRREALQRYEESRRRGLVAGDDGDEESSSEEEDDDDEDAIASRRIDRRVFDVIRRIRSGDPSILDGGARVYSSSSEDEEAGEEEEPKQGGKAKKERPLYLKDVNARDLLEEGPEFAARSSRSSKYDRIAYDEQQKKGLEAFLEADKKVLGDDDDDDDDDLFVEKPKRGAAAGGDDEEEDDEEEKQTKELAGEVFGDDEELDENEKFLKDFFLKRPYLESGKEKSYMDDIQGLSEEEELEKQEQYEVAYNFRHEEAAASGAVVPDRVLGHSRIVEGSVRKKESSRKQQRKSKEERIAQAKQEQAEELKHLKNLKKKEIAEKLERIRMIAGIDADAACKLGADDLDEDFDPEDYDRKMKQMFDESYYEADDVDPEFGSGEEMDLEKPDFDKEDELLGLPKGWALDQSEEPSTSTDGKAAKGKISLKDKVELEKEMEEYYKLDYEDTIGDLKTRFKYKHVKANSFGLSTYEILASDDRDLNQYVSMKKLAPYRESEWKVTHHKMLNKDSILASQKNEGKKDKAGKKYRSKEGPSSAEHKDSILEGKKKEGKKDKASKKSRSEEDPSSSVPEKDKLANEQEETGGKKKSTRSERRKRRHAELKMSTERQAAYGKINPKRHKSH
ncbi:hypothetical protein ACP4OV_028750 [Aristida adscensionis]